MNNNIRLRLVSAVLACALAAVAYGTAAQQQGPTAQQKKKARASKEPVVKERLVFAVNEGATTSVTHVELLQRYAGLGDAMENALRRPIKVEVYPDTARFRSEIERRRLDIVFGKTVNLLAGMIREKKYQAIVKTKMPYVAGFITLKGSPIKTPADLRGRVVMMPERVFTTKLGEATLRELGFKENDVTIRYTRFQEAVANAVETGSADVGVVNPTVKQDWLKKGNPVVLEAKPVPNWSIIASPALTEAELARLRRALIGLKDSEGGSEVLKAISVPEFVPAANAEYLDLLKFIGE
ncbi:MAG TPA: PhnD/SsuA/transferrin family substrate-binding protein [Burkholderiales bacterium]|nr:PhnD/SsuA/transferrin family substrate-binding protein [Burkholderiales bacterium]